MFVQKSFYNLLRGHRGRVRMLRKLERPDASFEDAYRLVQSFVVQKENLILTLTYNTKMFKRMKLTGTVPLNNFKSKKSIVAVYGPAEFIENTDAEVKISDVDDIEKKQFTHLIAHPSKYRDLIKLGKYLGQRDLMPSAKKGTVTEDLQQAIDACRTSTTLTDNNGLVDGVVGDTTYSLLDLKNNLKLMFNYINSTSNTTLDLNFVKHVHLRSTRGPAIPLKRTELKKMLEI